MKDLLGIACTRTFIGNWLPEIWLERKVVFVSWLCESIYKGKKNDGNRKKASSLSTFMVSHFCKFPFYFVD